ncbi:MAG: alkaline phosphatase family protein [Polyangiaceae bacterium]
MRRVSRLCVAALMSSGSVTCVAPDTSGGQAGPPHTPMAKTARPRAKVVVSLVVDQLAAWVANDRLPTLPRTGGFARLTREGSYVVDARFAHAATDTAPGHAALYTCAEPARSGVTSTERIDGSSARHHISFLRDDETRLVSTEGVSSLPGSSARHYALPTVADDLRSAKPLARIVSISLKDRSAIPGGGRSPSATLWFDPTLDGFVTSTAFAGRMPAWAERAASHSAVEALRSTPWTPLDEAWVASHSPTPDAQPGEGAWEGIGITFPHALDEARKPSQAFRSSPRGDEAILAIATAYVRSDDFASEPTLLALSLSSNDYVGHIYGVDSWEAWDNLERLDAGLAALFGELDRAVGPEGWAAVLAADHGVTPMPETQSVKGARPWCEAGADRWSRPCDIGERIDPVALEAALESAARRAMASEEDDTRWVLGIVDPYVVLSAQARALEDAKRDRLMTALLGVLRSTPGIAAAIDTSTLPSPCPEGDDDLSLVCRSFRVGAGDVYFFARPGSFVDVDYIPGHGTNHGSPRVFDRSIPILARDPGRIPAAVRIDEVEPFETFTRTVAGSLGLEAPAACRRGRDLGTLAPP